MIRNSILILIIAGIGWIMWHEYSAYRGGDQLNEIAAYYADKGPTETGAANLVTAIVVTYRGFDTLGEVTILFLTAAIIGFMLSAVKRQNEPKRREISEFLSSASKVLLPIIFLVGVYIFINGHLTPGGGFQGGAVLASAIILWVLSFSGTKVRHSILEATEALSGIGFVLLGVLGIFLAGGFLDNKILPLGTFGSLFSAGAIPVIYSLVGLKVGAELSKIILVMNETQGEEK
jgi:multicomponent Na+:H+ antiporter subunit B